MVKFKKLKTVLGSLFLAGAVASVSAVCALNSGSTMAYAAFRQVELDGNSVFYRAIRGAEITVSKTEKKLVDEKEEDVSFVKFNIANRDKQTVTYRQNLAYTWLAGDRVDEDDELGGTMLGTYTRNYFNMSLSFESLTFKRFIIKLQSQQYVLTKDGVTDNYIIFTPVKEDNDTKIQVSVSTSLDEDDDGNLKDEVICKVKKNESYEEKTYGASTVFSLAFDHEGYETNSTDQYFYDTSEYRGDYDLKVNGEYTNLKIKNVYEQFATYVSSGDNTVTPMTFSAQFAKGADEDDKAEMVLREINGQSFEVVNYQDVEAGKANPKVEDNAAPVMCFTETPSYIKYGQSISLSYKVIDVLASAPRSTAYYYVLTGEQYADDFPYDWIKGDFEKFNEDKEDGEDNKEDSEGSEDASPKIENPYIQVSSSSASRVIRDDKTFNPQLDNVYGLVKIYYEIADVSGSSKNDDVIFVDWYAKKDALVNIYSEDYKNIDGTSNFIKLIDDKPGVTYMIQDELNKAIKDDGYDVEEAYKLSVQDFQEYYQEKIDEAIDELEGKKLYAGGEKFYLPAIEWEYFMDDYFTARDYKYSIYYRAKNTGSNTSLASNMLAMDLNEADVTYTFTLYITDGFGNDMRYPKRIEEDGTVVWEKISASDIWDDDYMDLLPRFTVDVSYKKATAEDPESLSLAYVKTNYSGVSFKITGVSGTYTANYSLYVFDRNAFAKEFADPDKIPTFSEFVDNFYALFGNTYEGIENTRKYFTTVKEANQLLETDENYEKFKALNWSSSTLNFTPQSVEEYYVVVLTLTDNRTQDTSTNFATVAASVQTTSLKGESDWLEQNLTSVILLAVAGVCLIALLLLLIIKPKDKGDIDVVYAEVEEKQGKKSKKKGE